MDWFTIEEIDDKTFVISEYRHWEEVHSFLLIGNSKALLIDTGLGIDNIRNEVKKLTNLPIIVISTHLHWDHIGGHSLFDKMYVHENEVKWLNDGIPLPLDVIKTNLMKNIKMECLPKKFDINKYQVFKGIASRILVDNDLLDIGGRRIRVIHTPGHSPGHMCFFEEETGYFFSGDLIYLGTLYAFYETTNPADYKKSVDKISKIKGIKKIFPSHHKLDISLNIIERVKKAFIYIESKGKLHHGGGIFEFEDFNIML